MPSPNRRRRRDTHGRFTRQKPQPSRNLNTRSTSDAAAAPGSSPPACGTVMDPRPSNLAAGSSVSNFISNIPVLRGSLAAPVWSLDGVVATNCLDGIPTAADVSPAVRVSGNRSADRGSANPSAAQRGSATDDAAAAATGTTFIEPFATPFIPGEAAADRLAHFREQVDGRVDEQDADGEDIAGEQQVDEEHLHEEQVDEEHFHQEHVDESPTDLHASRPARRGSTQSVVSAPSTSSDRRRDSQSSAGTDGTLALEIELSTWGLVMGAVLLALMTWGLCLVMAWVRPGWWCAL